MKVTEANAFNQENTSMGFLHARVDGAFRNEKEGRVVVFAGDRPHRGYVLGTATEEAKIRSFLKMYYFADCSVLLFGSSLAFAWSTFFANIQSLGKPEEHLLRTMCIYLGMSALLVGVPSWLLWRSYKKSFLSFVLPKMQLK
ncbi:MAG: hypothetical protein WB607_04880 [Candidatus Acidiferrum sp.]|jgi:hypothetical protein